MKQIEGGVTAAKGYTTAAQEPESKKERQTRIWQ